MTPALETDLLTGCAQIATHLGWTLRQVKHRVATSELPAFRVGRSICARRSELEAHFARASAAASGPARSGKDKPGSTSRRHGDVTVTLPMTPEPGAPLAATLYGHRAIAAHLGLPVADVERLDIARRLPTYLDDGCTIASTAALDHWNAMRGGR